MNKATALKYEKKRFTPELIEMFSDLLSKRTYILQVFTLILERSLNTSEKQSIDFGITKTEIMETVKVHSKKKKGNKFVDAEIYMTKKACDDIVNFLMGATLIYYDERQRERPLLLTIRGKQIAKELIKRNIIKSPL